MATDRRTYVRVHDGLPDHPKIAEVGGMAAWLYVSGLCYASRHLTDGIIPIRLVARLTDLPDAEALASRLLEANLWHRAQHDCKDCPQGIGAVYVVHDYMDHQRSAAEVRELSEKRAAAGRNGGRASGETRRGNAKAEANAKQVLKQTRSKIEAETETETQLKEEELLTSATASPPADAKPKVASKQPKKAKAAPEPRPDVEALCNRLVELMAENGSDKPDVSDAWRTHARLLLDKDHEKFGHREPDKAMRLLEWALKNHFWWKNIRSIPTFRKQYGRLRDDALDEWRRNRPPADQAPPGTSVEPFAGSNVVAIRPNIPAPRPSTTDRAVASGDAALAEFRRMTGRTA
jgi:hypothetical protein